MVRCLARLGGVRVTGLIERFVLMRIWNNGASALSAWILAVGWSGIPGFNENPTAQSEGNRTLGGPCGEVGRAEALSFLIVRTVLLPVGRQQTASGARLVALSQELF